MQIDLLLTQIFQPDLITKILTLAVLAVFVVFTIVVFNQISVMNRIIDFMHVSIIIKALAFINILLSISLFILAFAIL